MMQAAQAAYDARPLFDEYGATASYPHTIHGLLPKRDRARQKPPKPGLASKRPSLHTPPFTLPFTPPLGCAGMTMNAYYLNYLCNYPDDDDDESASDCSTHGDGGGVSESDYSERITRRRYE